MTTELELTTPTNFDINKVVFGVPEEANIKDNKGKPTGETYCKCTLDYQYSKEETGPLIMSAPEHMCYGVQKNYKWGKPKTEEYFTGYSICYYLGDTDPAKKGEQSPDQKKFTQCLLKLQRKLSIHLKENHEFLPEKAADKAAEDKLVSPIAKYPKTEVPSERDPKRLVKRTDKSKPLRFYMKIIQNTKTEKFVSTFYGPGDKEMNPLDLLEVRGLIEPAIKFEYVYIGDNASVQIKLWECTYKPTEGMNRKRLIKKNTAPEDVPQTSDPNNDLVISDNEDPLIPPKKLLQKVIKKKLPPKKPPPKTTSKKSSKEEVSDEE